MMLYHLSDVFLGDIIKLSPRIPRDPMPGEDRSIPRICVSESIEGCLLALKNCYYNAGVWFVYQTKQSKKKYFSPINVPDAEQTGEKWLRTQTLFHYVRKME